MPEPILRLSSDRQRVVDEHGDVVYEAREIGGRTLFVEPGRPSSEVFCLQVGLKMACARWSEGGDCEEWTTIDVCVQWST